MSDFNNPFEKYLNKPIKVTCKDQRVIYGTLACVSSPYSIILQHGICEQPKFLDVDLDYHYNPQFPAKPFLVRLDAEVLNSFDEVNSIRNKLAQREEKAEENQELEKQLNYFLEKTEIAKKHNQEFMVNKYIIGSVVIAGENIEKIHLIQ